jgi:hypothetical protein
MKSFILALRLASLIFACIFSISTANISTALAQEAPTALASAALEKPYFRTEASVSAGVLHSWGRTMYGGTVGLGVLFPFNLYAGVELTGFYGNADAFNVANQSTKQMELFWYTQDHVHASAIMQVGYDIGIGSAFTLRPYLGASQIFRYYAARDERVYFSPTSWAEPSPTQFVWTSEGFVGLLASYHLTETLRLGINLRTNVSALLTLQYRL